MTSSKPKRLVPVRIPRHGPVFHLHIIKIWQMKKNTYMHFEEESIIYIWSKFQLDTCMFDSIILRTKFGPGFWFRIPGVGPGFYSFPRKSPDLYLRAAPILLFNQTHPFFHSRSYISAEEKKLQTKFFKVQSFCVVGQTVSFTGLRFSF